MDFVEHAFLATASLLWVSVYGYLSVLLIGAKVVRRRSSEIGEWPAIAVVIPSLNEAEYIADKIRSLEAIDYPGERMRLVVADGGSTDATVSLVRERIGAGSRIELRNVPSARGKTDQLHQVLDRLEEEVVLVTDADSELDPLCVKRLVGELLRDPRTAIVGAAVAPRSGLLEERLHWRVVNLLWWLEGEALFAPGFSGVCYAVRRSAVLPMDRSACTDDVSLALSAAARGFSVRLCPSARATELRVPQTTREMCRFRRRRGRAYLGDLWQVKALTRLPPAWRIAWVTRLWHFTVLPWLALFLVCSGFLLLLNGRWLAPLAAALFLVGPFFAIALRTLPRRDRDRGAARVLAASIRVLALNLLVLLLLRKAPLSPGQAGGGP